MQTQLTSWNRYPSKICSVQRPERYRSLADSASNLIARGQGRCYGDAALNEQGEVMLTERLNRLLAWDTLTGLLTAEAGLTLADLLKIIVPKGWFLPVTPGTQYVSLGGCVAADVHGKNHHVQGSFASCVRQLEMVTAPSAAEREWVTCSPEQNSELFWATLGGMGLTGIIGTVTLQLVPIETGYIQAQHISVPNLTAMLRTLAEETPDYPYSVAWIDGLATDKDLGRGIVMLGRHANTAELPNPLQADPLQPALPTEHAIPFMCPNWMLNRFSISTFNRLYAWANSRKAHPFLVDYQRYFYPLDTLQHWHRCYGKQGFLQYQFVVPTESACALITTVLQTLQNAKQLTFLGVLKRFGPGNSGYLSFPMAGYTLALDIPLRNERLFALLDQLDEQVIQAGGRVYLAKDARLSAIALRNMYPRYEEWLKIKHKVDPEGVFQSDLSRRLQMGGA